MFASVSCLHKIEGGCQVPIAAYGTLLDDGSISLTALVGSPNGKTILKETQVGEHPVDSDRERSLYISRNAKSCCWMVSVHSV